MSSRMSIEAEALARLRAQKKVEAAPLEGRTTLLLVALGACALVDLFAIWADYGYRSALQNVVHHGYTLHGIRAEHRHRWAELAEVLSFIATAIIFMLWFHRAYDNVRRLGVTTRWSPSWAVGVWFVPVLNLFRPKAIADDIWRGSDPSLPRGAMLTNTAIPWFLPAWWLTFIVAGLASRLELLVGNGHTVSGVSSRLTVAMAGLGVELLATGLAAMFVMETAARQSARARVLTAPAPLRRWTGATW